MRDLKKQVHLIISEISTIKNAEEYLVASRAVDKVFNDLDNRLKELDRMKEVQLENITDDYMHGLYNGMEYASTFFSCKDVDYIDTHGVKDSEKANNE